MKKVLFTICMLIGLLMINYTSSAQSNKEIGVRFGNDISIDATFPIGAKPRLHPAIYFDRFGIATYFDWLFTLADGPEGLKFYFGVGPELYLQYRTDFHIAGDFGIEYSFDFPLTLAIDWRPGFALTNNSDFYTNNWGFIARFRFGQGGFQSAN